MDTLCGGHHTIYPRRTPRKDQVDPPRRRLQFWGTLLYRHTRCIVATPAGSIPLNVCLRVGSIPNWGVYAHATTWALNRNRSPKSRVGRTFLVRGWVTASHNRPNA